jgi:hypothetical protein
MTPNVVRRLILVALCSLAGGPAASAQQQHGAVPLPYVFSDGTGAQWDVQYDGSIGDGGNDLYDGGGRLFVNNNAQYQSPNPQATLDAARHELALPPMPLGNVNISRRIAHLPALGAVRFTEVIENPTGSTARVQLRCYFNMGQAVQAAVPLVDERKAKRPAVGYAIGDMNNAVAMVGAGRGAKVLPRFQYQQNDDNVNVLYDVEVPARQTVAVVHVQLRRASAEAAAEAWRGARDKDLLASLPKDVRRRVVNFPGGDAFVGDLEVLRGDALDVVELRGGDSYRGTVNADRFRLQTLYGPVTLPAAQVVCLINVGAHRATQLLVTAEGEVFGGRLDADAVKLQLTGGQVTTVPLSQVTRLGFRRRPGEPDEWNFENKAVAHLRSGERVRVRPPAEDFQLATPAGPVRLSPAVVASIVFQGDDNNVPAVHLTDGTKLSGLLATGTFDLALAGPGTAAGGTGEQRVRLPTAALLRFAFAAEQETTHLTPTMALANHDVLVGTLGGTLSVETPFDTLHVDGNQVKSLAHGGPGRPGGGGGGGSGGDHDVQVTLWDDSTISGRLVESHVTCLLKCGVSIRVPIALLDRYDQPLPVPSPPVIERIRQVAKDLDADDWKVRDRAQSQILAIGPPVMSVLSELRPKAPAEAAQRIEVILNRLSRQLEKAALGTGMAPAPDDDGGDDGFVAPPEQVVPMLQLP